MSFGDYLFGVIGLAAVAIPMAMGGVRLRRRLLPGWVGAPARLAEVVSSARFEPSVGRLTPFRVRRGWRGWRFWR